MDDPYRLQRFVDAQNNADVYAGAIAELRAGRKQGHWMWFIFPQVKGLGFSYMAQEYGISSIAEAQAYVQHPVLGPRLVECSDALLRIEGRSATEILGSTDAMKLRSSMTLFMTAAPQEPVFGAVLGQYFDGAADQETIRRL
jgi:uncharacterized protein (DUF1810 family)